MNSIWAVMFGSVLCFSCGGHRPERNESYDFPDELISLLQKSKADCIAGVSSNPRLSDADRELSAFVPYALSQITTPADFYSIAPTTDVEIEVTTHSIQFHMDSLVYEYEVPEFPEEYPVGLWSLKLGEAFVVEQGSRYSWSWRCKSEAAEYFTSVSSEFPIDDPEIETLARSETNALVDGSKVTVRASSKRSADTWSGSYCINGACSEFESESLPESEAASGDIFRFDDYLIDPAGELIAQAQAVNK